MKKPHPFEAIEEPDLGYGTTCRNNAATCDCFVHRKWREQAKAREENK
jgi:hypothetical protein